MKAHHLAAVVVFSLAGLVVYTNSLDNDFVHDDNHQIVRNPYLHPDQPISRLLFSDVWSYQSPDRGGLSNYYRPLQMLTYRWTVDAAGLEPYAFHLVNLLFHLLATLAAYLVFWQLTRRSGIAFASALLFALHPIHTEAVAWIACLAELGCALFYFLSFWLFLIWVEPAELPPKGKRRTGRGRPEGKTHSGKSRVLVASLVCFAVAMLWKEMAVTLPFVVMAYVLLFQRRKGKFTKALVSAVRVSWPFFVVVVAYLVLRFQVLGFLSRSQQVWTLSPLEIVLSILVLVWQYWSKLLLPVQLSAFYKFQPVRSLAEPELMVASIFLLLAVALIAYGWQRSPLLSFAALWVFLTLIPVLNITGIGINVFTERYLYIPSLGFCLLLPVLFHQALKKVAPNRRFWIATTALLLLCVPYGAQTIRRNRDWQNDLVYYSRGVETDSSSGMHSSLSNALREKGDLDGAEHHARLALELSREEDPPDRRVTATAYVNLANICIKRGQHQQALEMAQKGMAEDSTLPTMKMTYAVALLHLGKVEEANRVFQEVLEEKPNDEMVLHFLGVISLQKGQWERAADYLEKALRILPDYPDARNNLAAAYVEMGRDGDALPHMQRAAQLRPRDPMAHTNLAVVLARLNRIEEARIHLRRALSLSPNFPAAVAELAALQKRAEVAR